MKNLQSYLLVYFVFEIFVIITDSFGDYTIKQYVNFNEGFDILFYFLG